MCFVAADRAGSAVYEDHMPKCTWRNLHRSSIGPQGKEWAVSQALTHLGFP